MAGSRSLKDILLHQKGIVGSSHKEDKSGEVRHRHAGGGSVDHWMQDVHPKKGALHKEMGIPEGKKIPTAALEKATHSGSGLESKRANLALRYRGL